MSAIGPKRTCRFTPHMSAFGGKADMTQSWQTRLGVTPRHNYLDSIRGKGSECPERAINMMWKDTGINAVVAVTSVIWIMAVAWLIGDALWQGLAAI